MVATIVDITRAGAGTASSNERLYWRAIVRVGGLFAASRQGDRLEWHLAACDAPHGEGTHCNEGLHLTETIGHPDGHCIVDDACGRCGVATTTRKAA